jgi:hypothetical protein
MPIHHHLKISNLKKIKLLKIKKHKVNPFLKYNRTNLFCQMHKLIIKILKNKHHLSNLKDFNSEKKKIQMITRIHQQRKNSSNSIQIKALKSYRKNN